jgi:hypothetical protein
MPHKIRTSRYTFLLRGREEELFWDIPDNVTPRHEEGFDVYEWRKSTLTYALHVRRADVQAIYVEGNESTYRQKTRVDEHVCEEA